MIPNLHSILANLFVAVIIGASLTVPLHHEPAATMVGLIALIVILVATLRDSPPR
jgi:hypothetical protein